MVLFAATDKRRAQPRNRSVAPHRKRDLPRRPRLLAARHAQRGNTRVASTGGTNSGSPRGRAHRARRNARDHRTSERALNPFRTRRRYSARRPPSVVSLRHQRGSDPHRTSRRQGVLAGASSSTGSARAEVTPQPIAPVPCRPQSRRAGTPHDRPRRAKRSPDPHRCSVPPSPCRHPC